MKPHKHAELIKAWADGAEIEYKAVDNGEWIKTHRPSWLVDREFRIKPEPKPDVVRYLKKSAIHGWFETNNYLEGNCTNAIIKLTFDGETGELKSAEVFK